MSGYQPTNDRICASGNPTEFCSPSTMVDRAGLLHSQLYSVERSKHILASSVKPSKTIFNSFKAFQKRIWSFLRDELHYENGYERQKGFHGSDKYISVDELWKSWKTSQVHNWTVDEIVQWLVTYVDLPQYAQSFQENNVNGTALPRMAANDVNFLTSVLGINDAIHRQKLALKAMDIVLFGPPKYHSYVKDTFLVLSLVVAVGGCWFAFVQHNYSKNHLQKMMNDMESLQKAENALLRLQEDLDKARQEQEIVVIEKENLEKRLQDEISTTKKQDDNGSNEGINRMQQLEEELEQARAELEWIKKATELRAWVPPPALQNWLQLTHEVELKHYNAKKTAAEQQLSAAKEGCEKLRRKRSTFMGTFRIAHGSSIDDVDSKILQAKSALSEVTQDLQERIHRWKQIELLCNFSVVCNPGLRHLEALLLGGTPSNSSEGSLPRGSSEAMLLEDNNTPVYGNAGLGAGSVLAGPIQPFPQPLFGYNTQKDSAFTEAKSTDLSKSPSYSLSLAVPTTSAIDDSDAALHQQDSPSEQEDEKNYEEDVESLDSNVALSTGSGEYRKPNFIIGDSSQDIKFSSTPVKKLPRRMVKSASHDAHFLSSLEASQSLHRHTVSESGIKEREYNTLPSNFMPHNTSDLTNQGSLGRRKKSGALKTIFKRNITNTVTADQENSTDSNSVTGECELKRRRKKSFLTELIKKKSKAL
ncbi:stromal interaction molecule 1-like isoform X1 [Limulus polyphemus]|uniref:Stromal interaction molecule 1-like isoform X1 n=1 Tax=Limulus polyphemus TaxID=6850 RepID=A0ABM1TEY2_LIMPO|nr:stromal interaction molecule 1-like isoform X1 [Limulus polyphemus]